MTASSHPLGKTMSTIHAASSAAQPPPDADGSAHLVDAASGVREPPDTAGGRVQRLGGPRPRAHLARGLLALVLAPLAVGTSGHAVAGLLPLLAAETGTTAAWVGQLASIFALVCAVGAPVLAVATGRIDRRRLLVACLLITAVGNALAAVATSFLMLVVARVVTALGAAMTTAVAVGLAAAATPAPRRARAMATVLGGLAIALALGVPGVAALAYHAGFRPAMWAVVALCLLAAAAIAAAAPRLPAPAALPLRRRLAAATSPGVLGILGAGLLAWASTGAVYPYLDLVVGGPAGPGGPLAAYLTAYGLGAALGTWLGGALVDLVGARAPLIAASVTGAVALLLLALAHTSAPAALALVAAWGAAGWATTPALNAWLDRLADGPAHAALLLALVGSVIYLGMGLGTVTGGLLVALVGVEQLALAAAVGSGLAAASFAVCGRRPGRARRPRPPAFVPTDFPHAWPLR